VAHAAPCGRGGRAKNARPHSQALDENRESAMKKLLATFSAILLGSCATTANYEKILNSWVGSSVDNLVSSWGPPQSSFELSDGGKVIEYVNARNVQFGGFTYSNPQTTYHSGTASAYSNYGKSAYGSYSGTSTTYTNETTPIQNIAMSCKTRFTLNRSGKITKWSWQGNDCKAEDPGNLRVSLPNDYKTKVQHSHKESGDTEYFSCVLQNGDIYPHELTPRMCEYLGGQIKR
jgi:hypothetical protein